MYIEKFHWKNGMLPTEEYSILMESINTIKDMVYPASGGQIINGKEYKDISLVSDIEDICESIDNLVNFSMSIRPKEFIRCFNCYRGIIVVSKNDPINKSYVCPCCLANYKKCESGITLNIDKRIEVN